MANWDDIRVFLNVARAESLSRAAPGLRMDPATLSRRIARLEDRLGQTLFVKSPQGYVLTEAGHHLMRHAARAEEALAPGLNPQGGEGLSGHIRIGAPDGCANFLLPQVCARLQRENPDLEVQILALPRVVNLSKREADLAITVSPPDTARLSATEISAYRLHLAARAEIASEIKSLTDLRAHPLIGYIPDMIFDRELDYLSGLDLPPVRLASNSVAVQLQMLRQGGVGIVHDFALPFAPELRPILTGSLSLTRRFYLVHHRSDHRSPRMKRLIAALRHGLHDELARLEAAAR